MATTQGDKFLVQIGGKAASIVALILRAQRGSLAPECLGVALREAKQLEADTAATTEPALLHTVHHQAVRMRTLIDEAAGFPQSRVWHMPRPDLLDEALGLAAAIAELTTIEVLRAGVSPTEEAAHYARLLGLPGYSVAKLADKVGKSRRDVDDRLNAPDPPPAPRRPAPV